MDAQLSLLMANQAMIKHGDIVLDPFVGTGELNIIKDTQTYSKT